MHTTIEVADRKEAEQIRAGLADPAVRAFVKTIGILSALPSDRAKARVLQHVSAIVADQAEA